jgi:hypothetical protein
MPEWGYAYFLGLLTAGLFGGVAWCIYLSVGNHNLHFGKMGEVSTAECLLTLRRRLQGWRLVNGLFFDGHGDVDHVLIGRGGIFAIESKWTNPPWSIHDNALVGPPVSPTSQARRSARKIANTLRSGPDPIDIPVVPVLVLWGPGAPTITEGLAIIDDVLVAEGRRRQVWVRQLNEHQLELPDRELR